jgi:sugar phosphate isomerase/epimerase
MLRTVEGETFMRLSGAAWSFVGASLRESRDIYRALSIDTIDVLASPGLLLDSGRIIEDPERESRELSVLQNSIANLIFLFASDFSQRALNHRDPEVRARNARDFCAVAEFCRQSGIPSVTIVPGVEQEGWSHEKSLAVSAEALNELAAIAAARGVTLLFEAHVTSVLESPQETLQFLQNNPQLKLTLDYSHFVFGGHSQEAIDALASYAGHVHLRQAARGVLQARWDAGEIDFAKVVKNLIDVGYRGYLALEYEHDAWMGNDQVDVMAETIKMRNVVLPILQVSHHGLISNGSKVGRDIGA